MAEPLNLSFALTERYPRIAAWISQIELLPAATPPTRTIGAKVEYIRGRTQAKKIFISCDKDA
jgi:hypothetical protein